VPDEIRRHDPIDRRIEQTGVGSEKGSGVDLEDLDLDPVLPQTQDELEIAERGRDQERWEAVDDRQDPHRTAPR
jgi:hypothetical protein